MSTRNVYQVVVHDPDWEGQDAGLYGTITRARAHVKREGRTRRYRQSDYPGVEHWITPEEEADRLGNVEHYMTIVTRRIR